MNEKKYFTDSIIYVIVILTILYMRGRTMKIFKNHLFKVDVIVEDNNEFKKLGNILSQMNESDEIVGTINGKPIVSVKKAILEMFTEQKIVFKEESN